jgi:hypothetical protein
MAKATLSARFWVKVDVTDTCWLWTGARTTSGYGNFYVAPGSPVVAHRVAFELLLSPIPDGMQLDHLCRVRLCVNPDHLEPVTSAENNRRSTSPTAVNARKTHCIYGHEFTDENIYVPPKKPTHRYCRECIRIRKRAY